MKNLIEITEQNGNSVVSARELHAFLVVEAKGGQKGEDFSNWIKRMLEYIGAIKNEDYEVLEFDYLGSPITEFSESNNQQVRVHKRDYAVTTDIAKEISVIQNNDKGKQARRYFINCEKQLKSRQIDLTDANVVLQLAQNFVEEQKKRLALEQRTELQSIELQKQAPKVAYCNEVLQSESTYNTNKIAKELGMSAISLNKRLKELRVQYKQNGTWLLYSSHQNKGYTKTETYTYTNSQGETKTSMSTVWTEKGRKFIRQSNVA